MAFPRDVKERILVATARHCCVCHRYKGIKIEVHHIVPRAHGGDDTFDNAIALCFDCHADAGHYDTTHPRGTRYSPRELEKAKEQWIAVVAANGILAPRENRLFHCQYFLCKSQELLLEIAAGNLARFPVDRPYLVRNEVLRSLQSLSRPSAARALPGSLRVRNTADKDQYVLLHPEAVIPDKSDGRFSYFEFIRIPSPQEIGHLAKRDSLVQAMLDANLPYSQIAAVGAYQDDCGDSALIEETVVRNVWCAFLAITNSSDQGVTLLSVLGEIAQGGQFSSLDWPDCQTEEIPLPRAPVPPGATVLLPIVVILPPLAHCETEIWRSSYEHSTPTQVVSHAGVPPKARAGFLAYGRRVRVTAFRYLDDGGLAAEQDVHEFDLGNMFTIDRTWECGSCPYLFFASSNTSFARELMPHCCGRIGADAFVVPHGARRAVIVELEDEETEIAMVLHNGAVVLDDVRLKKGQSIELPVRSGDRIVVVGMYVPTAGARMGPQRGARRNELVGSYLIAQNALRYG